MRPLPALAALLLAACGPSLPRLKAAVENSERRRILVSEFSSAPNSPASGGIAAAALAESLRELGYAAWAGAGGGPVDGVVTGEVSELDETMESFPPEYEERVRAEPLPGGGQKLYTDRVLVRPSRLEFKRVFRVGVRLEDPASGAVLWQSSTWVESPSEGEAELAASAMKDLARDLAKTLTRRP